jgi:hypothetical protein
MGESGKASPSIAAHSAIAPIRVEILHGEVGLPTGSKHEQTVCADAEVSIAERGGKLPFVKCKPISSVIDDDKIVAGTGRLCKFNFCH